MQYFDLPPTCFPIKEILLKLFSHQSYKSIPYLLLGYLIKPKHLIILSKAPRLLSWSVQHIPWGPPSLMGEPGLCHTKHENTPLIFWEARCLYHVHIKTTCRPVWFHSCRTVATRKHLIRRSSYTHNIMLLILTDLIRTKPFHINSELHKSDLNITFRVWENYLIENHKQQPESL